MTKEKVEKYDATVDIAKLRTLEQENAILKQKIADTERLQAEQKPIGIDLNTELKKIRNKGKSSANSIKVVEFNDHRNICLYTREGRPLGPMHPDNAIQTLNRFADLGIALLADKPTPEQVAAYCATDEYKASVKKESARRALKAKSKKSGQMEKLAAEIARMSGTTVDAINHILQQHEVKK